MLLVLKSDFDHAECLGHTSIGHYTCVQVVKCLCVFIIYYSIPLQVFLQMCLIISGHGLSDFTTVQRLQCKSIIFRERRSVVFHEFRDSVHEQSLMMRLGLGYLLLILRLEKNKNTAPDARDND